PGTLARPRPSGTHTRPARTPAGLSRPAPSAHPAWEKCTEVSRCDVYGRSCLPESTFPTRPRARPPRPNAPPPCTPRPAGPHARTPPTPAPRSGGPRAPERRSQPFPSGTSSSADRYGTGRFAQADDAAVAVQRLDALSRHRVGLVPDPHGPRVL